MEEAQREFLAEAEDLVEQLLSDLDELRFKQGEGRVRRELLDRIFRHVHSVKGLGASAGFMRLSEEAHEFEGLLASVRSGYITLEDSVLESFDTAAGSLSDFLQRPGIETEPTIESSQPKHVTRQANKRQEEIEAILNELPHNVWESLNEAEKHKLYETLNEGAALFLVETSFDVANFEEYFDQLRTLLARTGDLISTAPTVDSSHPDKINFRILYARADSLTTIREEIAGIPGVTVAEVERSSTQVSRDSVQRPYGSLANFIRTDLEDLDQLISTTHELFRATTETIEFAMVNSPEDQFQRELAERDDRIRQRFRGLEEQIIRLRMVPVDRILRRAARAGQSAARYRNRDVEIDVLGGSARLDKVLCDAIADPLVHLVRNAVDHGIEDPEDRLRAGKLPVGKVTIQFSNEGSQNRIRVIDDGRGLDRVAISEAAAARGLIEEGAVVDLDKALRLIFRPGFSSVGSATDISGRGVGLDVVESAIEQVGGDLRVATKPGEGTTFEIRLPVTVGLLYSIAVHSAGGRYLLPANVVLFEVGLDKEQIETRSGSMTWDSEKMSFLPLHELLGQPAQEAQPSNALICEFVEAGTDNRFRRLAIGVESVTSPEEVLVRSLGRHAARWPGVAGASELRDGSIAIVLDLPRLVSHFESA